MTGHIYSIGHGGRSVEGLMADLRRLEVRFLVDVRSSPYSRFQPDFSRDALEALLTHSGLSYVFMGEALGGRPDDPACYTAGKVDYGKCRESNSFRAGIRRLLSAHGRGLALCLLCSEAKPEQCHRSKLIGAALHDAGIEMTHILPDGSTRAQADVIRDLTGGQGGLFGEQFVSRKTYQ